MNLGPSDARLTSHYVYTLICTYTPYRETERSELRKIQQSLKTCMHNHLKTKRYNFEVRHPRCVGSITKNFCVLHVQSNTTIFHLVLQ